MARVLGVRVSGAGIGNAYAQIIDRVHPSRIFLRGVVREESAIRAVATELAYGMVERLSELQMADGAISAIDGGCSPVSEYAHSFSALAIGLLASRSNDTRKWERAARAAEFVLTIPATDRSLQEFNTLALLMLLECARNASDAPTELVNTLETAYRPLSSIYNGSRVVSNNWLAMRAVCFLLHAKLFDNAQAAAAASTLLTDTLNRQLDDGIFVDYPGTAHAAFATPLAYHAKTCAMLAIASRLAPEPRLTEAFCRGIEALRSIMSPAGECLYYGRSCNSLFGLAAAYYAFCSAGCLGIDGDWHTPASLVLGRIADRQRPDRLLRLTAALDETNRPGWDVYYHLEVYNAYAAAMLLAAPALPIADPPVTAAVKCSVDGASLPASGLVTVGDGRFFAAFSTKGQCVLDGSSLFCDNRYIGLQPQLIELDGIPIVSEPPLLWTAVSSKALAVTPDKIGFQPWIDHCGLLSTVRVYDEVAVRDTDCGRIRVLWGRGVPVSLELPSLAARILQRILHRTVGSADPAFAVRRCEDVTFLRTIVVVPEHSTVLFVDGYSGRLPTGAVWHALGTRMLDDTELQARFHSGGQMSTEPEMVPTSRGLARLVGAISDAVSPPTRFSVLSISPPQANIEVRQEADDRLRLHCGNLVVIVDPLTGCLVNE